MALSFAMPIAADFTIRVFAMRAAENADGWGLAWYPDHSLALVKEALDWRGSQHSKFLESSAGLKSSIYLAHVRHRSTGGPPTYADTHPFERELAGCHFGFAHNGTINDYQELPLGRFRPLGGTDSERLFCHLLALIEARGAELKTVDVWTWMHETLQRLNERGTINCLLSDGRRLFCYHDLTAWKGLTYRQLRFAGGEERRFQNASVQLQVDSDVYNSGYVVATSPLSRCGWHSFVPGQMIVLEHGCLVHSSEATAECAL